MVMSFHDLERRMKRNPKEEIRKLAKAAADSYARPPFAELHAEGEASGARGSTHQVPERKSLRRHHANILETAYCTPKGDDLVLLKLNAAGSLAFSPDQHALMPIDEFAFHEGAPCLCEAGLGSFVAKSTL